MEHPREPRVPPLAEALSKRLTFLTRTIFLLSAASLIVFIANIDAQDYQRDYEALCLLESITPRTVSPADPQFGFNEFLLQHHTELLGETKAVRISLVQHLLDQGFEKDVVLPAMASRSGNYSSVGIVFDDDEKDKVEHSRGHYTVRYYPQTVGGMVDRFRFLSRPRPLAVVTSIELRDLPPLQSQDGEGWPSWAETREPSPRLLGFHVDCASDCWLVISVDPPPLTGGHEGQASRFLETTVSRDMGGPEGGEIAFSAECVEVEGPSLAAATDQETDASWALYNDTAMLDRLRGVYGGLYLQHAREIASEYAVRSYRVVDILGMSFAAHRLPLAVASVLLFLSGTIAVTVRKAARRDQRIVERFAERSLLGITVSWIPARIGTLIVLPLLAIWFSLPPFPLGNGEQIFLMAASAAILGLGTLSTVQMHKL